MLKSSVAYLSLLFLLGASGCEYYYGDDDDDDCAWGGDSDAPYYEPDYLRNPESGVCEYFGGGGGGCYDGCGPCDYDEGAAFLPTWAFCDSSCEALDETTCLGTSGCRGVYVDNPAGPAFWQCWGTDQSGPIQGGGCDSLDAYSCSLHDDCIAVHASDGCGGDAEEPGGGAPEPCTGIGWFEYCADESTGCYGDDECGEGMHCNAGEVCLPPPGCEDESDPGFVDCDAACYGYCVPDDTPDPGTCTGDVFCDSLAPDCPEGTTPGIKDGCWTGYCIPLELCDDPPPPPLTCPEIGNEAQCIDREDCTAFYEGVDCVCDEFGVCECADWIFVNCQ
jgi:hypothetical protein